MLLVVGTSFLVDFWEEGAFSDDSILLPVPYKAALKMVLQIIVVHSPMIVFDSFYGAISYHYIDHRNQQQMTLLLWTAIASWQWVE